MQVKPEVMIGAPALFATGACMIYAVMTDQATWAVKALCVGIGVAAIMGAVVLVLSVRNTSSADK